jgi:hypothetical protein
MQRYPVVGGAAAWRLPILTAMLALAGLAMGAWAIAACVVVLGVTGHRLWRSVVIEVSPDGLARGLALDGRFTGPTTSLPWRAVVTVETRWWGPDDHRALETDVRSRDGRTIRFSTAMGLRSYWTCLAEIVRWAPDADRAGLTVATLAGGPPARCDVLGAVRSSAVLALVLGAMVGLGYVLAQGRSSLLRSLDDAGVPPLGPRAECDAGGVRIEAPSAIPRCDPPAGGDR